MSPKYSLPKIDSEDVLKKLLSDNIFELDTGIKWDELDWFKSKEVSSALNQVVDYLRKI